MALTIENVSDKPAYTLSVSRFMDQNHKPVPPAQWTTTPSPNRIFVTATPTASLIRDSSRMGIFWQSPMHEIFKTHCVSDPHWRRIISGLGLGQTNNVVEAQRAHF